MRTQQRSPTGEHRHHKGIVFVVDDDLDLLAAVQTILENKGYLVLEARNGNEALSRMKGISGPCTALVDLLMPGMDGWQLVRAMKADPELAGIPIITCSAHQMEPVEATRAHLRKPIKAETLLAAVGASLTAQ